MQNKAFYLGNVDLTGGIEVNVIRRTAYLVFAATGLAGLSLSAAAEGIVDQVVSSPLSMDGTVVGARTGINIYLNKPGTPVIDFMNPDIVGYGIPPGGHMEVELGKGFERDASIPIAQPSIMMVTGAPQQGMPGKAIGYKVTEGDKKTFVITPTGKEGLVADKIMTPAPGAVGDPVRSRGIKVVHVGLKKAFINGSGEGEVSVRIFDAGGKVVDEGKGSLNFQEETTAQVFPTNFAHGRRNHNWQIVAQGETVGHAEGTVPITAMLYEDGAIGSKAGIVGAGVLSTQQLAVMEYKTPDALLRYNGGLIIQDTSGDGVLDPNEDQVIGGVIGTAPKGASGQELKSLVRDGVATLSRPTTAFEYKPGTAVGGAIMLLEFTSGDKPGLYRPTLALLKNPKDATAGDGSSYTWTVVVQ